MWIDGFHSDVVTFHDLYSDIYYRSYEEMHIHNVNSKTAELCRMVGEYIIRVGWGERFFSEPIWSLVLTVDGKEYKVKRPDFAKDRTIFSIWENIASAKEVDMELEALNLDLVDHRVQGEHSFFGRFFTDDPDMLNNVVYRCIEDYDEPGIGMFKYDKNGLQEIEYTQSAECAEGVKRWNCTDTTFYIEGIERLKEDEELRERIRQVGTKLIHLLTDTTSAENIIDEENRKRELEYYAEMRKDNFVYFEEGLEDGIISIPGTLSFRTKDIPAIVELMNQIVALIREAGKTEKLSFGIDALPEEMEDGYPPYPFMSLSIAMRGDAVVDKYCRY